MCLRVGKGEVGRRRRSAGLRAQDVPIKMGGARERQRFHASKGSCWHSCHTEDAHAPRDNTGRGQLCDLPQPVLPPDRRRSTMVHRSYL